MVGFVVKKGVLAQVFLPVLRFPQVSNVPQSTPSSPLYHLADGVRTRRLVQFHKDTVSPHRDSNINKYMCMYVYKYE